MEIPAGSIDALTDVTAPAPVDPSYSCPCSSVYLGCANRGGLVDGGPGWQILNASSTAAGPPNCSSMYKTLVPCCEILDRAVRLSFSFAPEANDRNELSPGRIAFIAPVKPASFRGQWLLMHETWASRPCSLHGPGQSACNVAVHSQ